MRGYTRYLFIILQFVLLNAGNSQTLEYREKVAGYIGLYHRVAVNEMMLYGIPASITLAQGIIESAAGTSKLAINANNHFGIKCHKEWKGSTFIQDDDTEDECFRKYQDPLESFRDHSLFLTSRDRYKSLFILDKTDYKGWATGLKAAGYATNPKYAEMLVKTIENYELHRFDIEGPSTLLADSLVADGLALGTETLWGFSFVEKHHSGRDVFKNNRLKLIIARGDDNIYQIATDFGISVEKLLRFNDLAFATSLKPGQIVYLEKKRRKAKADEHRLADEETLYGVAQQYGIRLDILSRRNHLDGVPVPRTGTVLKLR
jgi:hypothetical protein